MKFLLPIIFSAFNLGAAQFTTAWNPSSGATNYELTLIGIGTTNVFTAQTAQTQITWTNLTSGITYRLTGIAVSAQGVRSDPSTNFFILVPDSPNGFRVIMLFESAPEPRGPWTTQSNLVMEIVATDQNRFYRGRMSISQR